MRSVSDTRKEVIAQLEEGEAGVDVTSRQRNSGVKDTEATYWIEGGKEKSVELRSDLQDMLTGEELACLPPPNLRSIDKINPYLNLEGTYIRSILSAIC